MRQLPPALTAALRPALPTLAAGALAGLYVILMLAAGNRDTQLFGYALALGLAVLVPFEATAFWLRRGAPLPALPLPALATLAQPVLRLARQARGRDRGQPEAARVVPAE
ncbi:hypothetical protein [Pararhodobacter aggregans]|uniref:Uncharacterized protein n=1 Tax=Pararhodobacter aggregans TaxID=404875 RepID=A0A2T7UVB3_9RHOB|nr:hypothetical protein [Pararhodobacter aggregans]PTX04020.1 hypothetical protein C8N33_102295 [Pararhodobacter aggregans]PVE48509.1 hypothetical protein DDE23_05495 [Pararhodobacter aggregans]